MRAGPQPRAGGLSLPSASPMPAANALGLLPGTDSVPLGGPILPAWCSVAGGELTPHAGFPELLQNV